ncbi:glycoside hydrolase family 3 C-terminal domain-containing protein [Sphingomonas sp. NIBR02145]|uniref:glycoside hydrolase family 3 C-terminal domain-containing protein n=1 Tax=Sphingomonas sp. NIBR02145 TaxID=3014784 RepID=UPI0022B30AFC|nr:glycoside hydrolase family 3 C-terminal domain-containing protein [Sphingomonas sp. NIBR02145]WHU04973.1 glycoside hydrolase family 3 C-terminal domain-containing protein [Sphingomonas sp. NIBR02145]
MRGLSIAFVMTLSVPSAAGLAPASAQDAEAPVYRRLSAPLDARVDDLIARMTLDEKIALLAGASSMTTNGVPRLGVPGIKMTDGPTGVRSPEGKPATVFPVGAAIAATWNPALAAHVGGAIAEEARADGASVLLAPTVNIVRTPRWGRNFETYSEDPYLTAQIALGYVGGVQREGIGVSLKHFVANNQETNRFFVDARVSERALRELYFPAFEAVVKQADPWSVMASYNKVNGTYVSQNRLLLTDVLKKDWGFPGAVVSDWGATHSTAPAANAGLDLEMPGPPAQFGAKLRKAVDAGEVKLAQIDDNARRVLRMILRSGVLDRAPSAPAPARNHADVARAAAEEAIVLLKNQAVLPLGSDIRTLAVIGPNAASARMQGGGSSEVVPFDAIASPLAALRAAYPGVRITYAQGVDNEETPPAADAALFSPDAGHADSGLQASYFAAADFAGEPVRSARETRFIKRISGNVASASVIGYAALRWEGWLWPRRSGRHELSIRGTGSATLILDGKTILDKSVKGVPDARDVIGFPVLRRTVALDLEAGRGYRIRLDYATGQTPYEALAFGLREPSPSLDEAVAAARAADAAIVLVGSSSTTEGEGYDRPTLALPGEQDKLVAAVAAANPRTVVVVNSGAAVTMPWRDQVPAILQLWFPGQEGAQALAAILAGRVNPSGKLPVSFPASDADDRADLSKISSDYSEDLLVGYRKFDTAGTAPLFAFGHGLSYSRFGYSALKAPRRLRGGAPLKVQLTLRNQAGPGGKEVVQLYVAPAERGEGEPVRQLRAFAKVALAPGESRRVSLTIDPRAFATWDEAEHRWRVRPGAYSLQVGGGSDDIRLRGEVMVAGGDAFVP